MDKTGQFRVCCWGTRHTVLAPRPLQSLDPQEQFVAVPCWPSVHAERLSVTTASHVPSSAVPSCAVAGTIVRDWYWFNKQEYAQV
jgi:hypothetical protein